MDDNDAHSLLKKRARRRLVGAVTFASVVAVVLPMVMDHQPRQVVDEVEIRIPGQDEKPFAPKFAVTPVEKVAPKTTEPPADSKAPAPAESVPAAEPVAPTAKVVEGPKEKPAEKPPVKGSEKTAPKPEKPPEKAAEKPVAAEATAEAKRAAAILAGQGATPDAAPAKAGEFVILIGAFANEENVRNLRAKLAEKNVKTYVEALDTPGGKKTRVRAGPFGNREAAEKALEKMKQVGVSGVISGK
ncbi:MAG: SPOR domain-containing protein [Azonexus sp.]